MLKQFLCFLKSLVWLWVAPAKLPQPLSIGGGWRIEVDGSVVWLDQDGNVSVATVLISPNERHAWVFSPCVSLGDRVRRGTASLH